MELPYLSESTNGSKIRRDQEGEDSLSLSLSLRVRLSLLLFVAKTLYSLHVYSENFPATYVAQDLIPACVRRSVAKRCISVAPRTVPTTTLLCELIVLNSCKNTSSTLGLSWHFLVHLQGHWCTSVPYPVLIDLGTPIIIHLGC